MTTLPQLARDRVFMTDGGLETTLIFDRGMELPAFASFPLLDDPVGRAALREYFAPELRAEAGEGPEPILVAGVIGPRGDGYQADTMMSAAEAESYHADQARALADADFIAAVTMTYAEEAIGIARAAARAGLPAAISITVETDGRLPSGQALGDAIEQVDAETDGRVAYFMVNCAHPTHFEAVVAEAGSWRDRARRLLRHRRAPRRGGRRGLGGGVAARAGRASTADPKATGPATNVN